MLLVFSSQVIGKLPTFVHLNPWGVGTRQHILMFMPYGMYLRHNACGLKEIALEFILRNLNDPAVMAGLSVSISALSLHGVSAAGSSNN